MMRICLVPVALAGVLLSQGAAEACSLVSPAHRTDLDTSVTADLPAPSMSGVQIERGTGTEGGQGDCADLGFVTIGLSPVEGIDLSAHGLLVEVQSGELPVVLDSTSSWKIEGSQARLIMSDGYGQPAFSAVVTLRLVNSDGEVGDASAPITIAHAGGAGAGGCTCVGRARGASAAIVLLGLWALVGRRRRIAP